MDDREVGSNPYTSSNSSTSPIIRPDSDFFDFYDSVSNYSGSTIADSEVVAKQIKDFERSLGWRMNENNQSTVYNLHIKKVVIPNGNFLLIRLVAIPYKI